MRGLQFTRLAPPGCLESYGEGPGKDNGTAMRHGTRYGLRGGGPPDGQTACITAAMDEWRLVPAPERGRYMHGTKSLQGVRGGLHDESPLGTRLPAGLASGRVCLWTLGVFGPNEQSDCMSGSGKIR